MAAQIHDAAICLPWCIQQWVARQGEPRGSPVLHRSLNLCLGRPPELRAGRWFKTVYGVSIIMTSPASDSAAPVTKCHPFFRCESDDKHYHLFEVAEGIPALLALEHSVRILHAAYTTFSELVAINPAETPGLGSVFFQIEIAKSLIDSVIDGFVE